MQNKFIMALEKPTPFTLSFKTNSKHTMILDIVAKSYNQNRSEYLKSMIKKGMTLQEELDAANEKTNIFKTTGLDGLLQRNKGRPADLYDNQGDLKKYPIETMEDLIHVLILTAKNHHILLRKNKENETNLSNK